MLNLKKIAITGTLSSGKSSVCKILQRLGAYSLSADDLVHQLLTPQSNIGQQIIALLGPNIVEQGQISRQKIAKQVLNNPKLLTSLENLLHPEVQRMIESDYKRVAKEQNNNFFVVEIPLLFEAGWQADYDAVVCVDANEEARFQRYHQATGRDRSDFEQRQARQLSAEEKRQKADYVIVNNGSLEELEQQMSEIVPLLQGTT